MFPEKFVDQLPAVLADAPPIPGEEARYAQLLAVIDAANKDLKLKAAMTEAAAEAEMELVKPPRPVFPTQFEIPTRHQLSRGMTVCMTFFFSAREG